jgi:hypothetical protein
MALVRMQGDRLLSLAELMYRYKLGDFALMFGTATKLCTDLSTSDQLQQPICDDRWCADFPKIVEGLLIMCRNFEADPALLVALESLLADSKSPKFDRREGVIRARLKPILDGIQNNLNSRAFMYIPAERAKYWQNFDILGEDFILGFPRAAVFEMLEIGYCFAAGRNTACVFHSIRVAEYGLRKLAKKLHVSVSDKDKKHPLEYADWDKVITAIRNKILEIRTLPRGPRKEKKLQFYSGLADQCEYMKDIWRNEIMHSRRRYNEAEALAVITRVRDFVEPLAKIDAKTKISKRLRKLRAIQQFSGGAIVRLAQLIKGQAPSGEESKKAEQS